MNTWLANIGPQTGPTYTYAYDTMGRPISLTDNQPTPAAWVNNVQYGLSSELLQITYGAYYSQYGAYYSQYSEGRTYNSRLQLTQVGSMQYTCSPTQNNGQITKQK